jgi:hypothetical protein
MANDTHGAGGTGWYGFDLDGTLAKYDGWKGIDHIGEPVKPMVELMKRMHDEGYVVKIMTARVAPRRLADGTVGEQFTWMTREPSSDPTAKYTATQYIQDWCEETAQLGFVPEIVYQKDHLMLELYDDRVKHVVPNTGVLVEDIAKSEEDKNHSLHVRLHRMIDSQAEFQIRLLLNRGIAFFCGCVLMLIASVLIELFVLDTDESKRATAARELHDAACRYLKVSQESLFEKIQKDNLTPASGL